MSSTQFDVERREMVCDAHIEGVLMYNNYYFKMASTDCMNVILIVVGCVDVDACVQNGA